MSEWKETSTSKWPTQSDSENGVFGTGLMQDSYMDEIDIIMDGVKSNINSPATNTENLTIDFESNKKREDQKSHSSLLNTKPLKPTEIEKSLKVVSKSNKPAKASTFYHSVQQYEGTIQTIDENAGTFSASMTNIDEKDDILLAEFSFKDISFASDRELIRIGAKFIWLIGQEMEHGTITNIARFIFRRTPVIRGKTLQEAKDNAREWAKLFGGLGTAETAKN